MFMFAQNGNEELSGSLTGQAEESFYEHTDIILHQHRCRRRRRRHRRGWGVVAADA